MDSNLQNKLQQFSPTPPEGVWNKIAAALDEEGTYAERLFQYEEVPPLSAWTAIEKNLEEPATVKVVPFTKRFSTPLRYAAVACFIAVILITITLTVKRTEAGAIQANSNTTVPTEKPVATSTPAPVTGEDTKQVKNRRSEQATASSNTKAIKPARTTTASAIAERKTTLPAKAAYPASKTYVTFSDGDGKLRKVSKKMAGFIQCSNDDAACKQRLQRLRQKMAASVITTDFTGVLEMLRQLQ